jgi:hypothetical protein
MVIHIRPTLLLALLLEFQIAPGQITETKILPGDGDTDDSFGASVALAGDYAIIGAPFDENSGDAFGSAYIFRREGFVWVEEAKLTTTDGLTAAGFGTSVAIDGEYAVVGTVLGDGNVSDAGSAYVFHRSGTLWMEEARLTASDGLAFDDFGRSVSISGDHILVGAPSDDNGSFNEGSAYVFRREGGAWTEVVRLVADDASVEDYFGQSVSIEGTVALISGGSGAYVFQFIDSLWQEEATLLPDDDPNILPVSTSVSLSGDRAVIGAPNDDVHGEFSGSAYVFRREGAVWVGETKLTPDDGTAWGNFGVSVSLTNDLALIGADGIGTTPGKAYLFGRNGTSWSEAEQLSASDGEIGVLFGGSVALYSDQALVGAEWDSENGSQSGSAYMYSGFAPFPPLPSAVQLLVPEDNAVNTSDSVTFVWNGQSTPVDGYWFEYDNDSLFASSLVDSALTDTTTVISQLTEGQYLWRVRAHNEAGWGPYSEVREFVVLLTGKNGEDPISAIPAEYILMQNYPNPFNPATTIRFALPRSGYVKLEIFNMLGEQMRVLSDGLREAGHHSIVFEAKGLPSGLYFYRLHAGDFVEMRKLLLLK